MEKILVFLGFEITSELKDCLLKDLVGNFKRKTRPQKQMDQIYKTFTPAQMNGLNSTYKKYLKKFKTKLIDAQIRQHLEAKFDNNL